MRNSRGQALSETLVIMAALVPLVFLGFWVAKVADMQLATGAAAKKMAFECTRRATDCKSLQASPDIVDAARIHAFGAPGREVLTADVASDQSEQIKKDPLWTDHKGRSLLVSFGDVSAAVNSERFDATASILRSQTLRNTTRSGLELVSNLAGPGHFGFDTFGGFVKGHAQIRIASDRGSYGQGARLDPFALTAHRHVAILTDQWNSTGANNGRPDSTQARVNQGSLLPLVGQAGEDAAQAAYALTRVNMGLMSRLLVEPTANQFRFHRTDVSIVPADRVMKK
jgi:hypothetical protein